HSQPRARAVRVSAGRLHLLGAAQRRRPPPVRTAAASRLGRADVDGGGPMTDSTNVPAPSQKTSSGLDQNVAGALTYLLGPFTGLIFLLVEKENAFVRFHAMQSLLTFGGLFLLYMVLLVTLVLAALIVPLALVELVLWILLMVKAFSGERFKLPWVGEFAEQ